MPGSKDWMRLSKEDEYFFLQETSENEEKDDFDLEDDYDE